MYMRKLSTKELKSHFIAFLLIFSDVLMNPNLNLLYMLGAFLFVQMLMTQRRSMKEWALLFCPLLFLPYINRLFYFGPIEEIKVVVYLLKMAINISLMIWIKNNFYTINVRSVFRHSYHWLILLFVVALLFRNETFWRLNDTINGFSKVRLKLLYSEPSVLGLFCCAMLLMLSFSILADRFSRRRMICLGLLLTIMILTFSLSGILYYVIGLVTMLGLYYGQDALQKRRIKVRVFLITVTGLLAVIFVLITENQISGRINAIFAGSDSSFAYRWLYSSTSIKWIMEETNFAGLGMGNMSTDYGIAMMQRSGISGKYSNSFLYFIGENGLLGLAYIVFVLGFCIKGIMTSKKRGVSKRVFNLKFALWVTIVIEQIFGGYFTDPLIWCIYGIICASGMDEKRCRVL